MAASSRAFAARCCGGEPSRAASASAAFLRLLDGALRGLELLAVRVHLVAEALKLVVKRRLGLLRLRRRDERPGSNFWLLPKLRWNQTPSSRAMRSWCSASRWSPLPS